MMVMAISFNSYAYVIQGQATVPVLDGKISSAENIAREKAMINALKNYFGRLKKSQPNREIPDVTTEFFKFIKSYKITTREYKEDAVNYIILADVDDVALNDLMYFVKNIVNTMVYNIRGVRNDIEFDARLVDSFREYKFETKHQSDFQASLEEKANFSKRHSVFKESSSQYYMDMSAIVESASDNQCTVLLTTKTFSKTKEFKTLKTKSTSEGANDKECVQNAFNLSLLKTLSFVRQNFIPLAETKTVENTFNVIAENYSNFAAPKKLMDELKKRSFIKSYKIVNFAGNKLNIEVVTYVDIDVLIKKLQSIEDEYGFSANQGDSNNILLDFTL
jgi:hypothetical protein